MKKIFLAVSMCLCLVTPAFAIDSTALSDSRVLGTAINQSASVAPVGTVITWASDKMPNDGPGVWLECDGRAIPSDTKYQDLRDYLMSNNTPNYTNQFLRGGTSAQVGQVAVDSTRSHAHQMNQHQHTVSGTAGGQSYSAPSGGGGGGAYVGIRAGFTSLSAWPTTHQNILNRLYMYSDLGSGIYIQNNEQDGHPNFLYLPVGGGGSVGSVTGGGTITGVTNTAGATSTKTTGGAETAPQHTRVRYLIRALP